MIAALVLFLYFTKVIDGILCLILLVVAAVLTLTSIARFCPLYAVLGFSTCARRKKRLERKLKVRLNVMISLFYFFVVDSSLFAQQKNRQIELNHDLILLAIILLVVVLFVSISKKHRNNKEIEKDLESRVSERTTDLHLIIKQLSIERNERKLAELVLKKSEEQYRYLFERNPAILFIYDQFNFEILDVNDAFLTFYGYSKDAALSMKLFDLYPGEDKKTVQDLAEKGKEMVPFSEWHHLKSNGSVVSIIGESRDMTYLEKKAHIVLITDLTIRKNAEEQVRKLNQSLEERVTEITNQLLASNKELESFSYSISHDLRAPLRAIYGFSQILSKRHRESLNEEGKQYMDYIVQACVRMEQLINDLLTYSRLGRKYLVIVSISLGDIIDEMRLDFKQRLDEIGAEFITEKEYPVIYGEYSLLRLIFFNLIDNAIMYRRVGVKPIIRVHCEKDETGIIVMVSDNGIGIPAEYLDMIFNIFQRLHFEEDYPGTGIGLASVRKAVQILDGVVWAESVVGEGSTFKIHFPESKRPT